MNDISPARQQTLTFSHQLARHVATTPFTSIPKSALDAAKLFLLDTLAVAWAGSDAPGCREAHAHVVEEGGRGDATAWAYGGRLPASAAAFINGMSSAALDYDALGRDSPVHVAVTVLPAALALAERQHASGTEFLTAAVLGADVMTRMGAADRARYRHGGFFQGHMLNATSAGVAAAPPTRGMAVSNG